ncbi:6-carboxytetrahydropterin synthase [Lacticaseibacillus jixiensis]|uniref:6-carboxytetrahydropterin synthase n=1 Tax=Lacticaseibacillus jixiensis TaxID=3231926 RepID=UPI0036F2A299
MIYTYKLKSYVNASHAMRWESGQGKAHNHTWEIVAELSTTDGMVAFVDLEKEIQAVLHGLSGKFLNDLPAFATINPSVENVTRYLFDAIAHTLEVHNAKLLRLEVSDSPTRSFCMDVRG